MTICHEQLPPRTPININCLYICGRGTIAAETHGMRSATKTRASSSCSCNVIAHAQCLHKSNAKRDDRANARVANVNKRTCSNRAIMDGVVQIKSNTFI